jgi:hypothetical protein
MANLPRLLVFGGICSIAADTYLICFLIIEISRSDHFNLYFIYICARARARDCVNFVLELN